MPTPLSHIIGQPATLYVHAPKNATKGKKSRNRAWDHDLLYDKCGVFVTYPNRPIPRRVTLRYIVTELYVKYFHDDLMTWALWYDLDSIYKQVVAKPFSAPKIQLTNPGLAQVYSILDVVGDSSSELIMASIELMAYCEKALAKSPARVRQVLNLFGKTDIAVVLSVAG